jgi:signal transduction histidine kinase/ActR/RegA family two-component response regulator
MFTFFRRQTASGSLSRPSPTLYYVLAAVHLASIATLVYLGHLVLAQYQGASDINLVLFHGQVSAWSLELIGIGVAAGSSVLVLLLTWGGRRKFGRIAAEQAALEEAKSALAEQNAQLARQADELRQAGKQAEEASRSKSEFLAAMSHEIRTPMTAILGFAENLLSSELPADDQILAVQTIRRNGEHLLEVINDMLDLSKIESGRLAVESVPCSIVQLLADVASLMGVRAAAKRLELRVEYRGPVPETILSDPARLRQILANLIGNAIKFTSRGTVRVVVQMNARQTDSAELRIDVIDTGLGMTPQQIAGLFQPFSQADSSATRQFGGTGLSLSISKRLIEMLSGAIAVASRPGQGTTFATTIPVKMPTGTPWFERPSEAITQPRKTDTHLIAKISLEQCNVLVADDGPDNQRLISFLLRKAGATVTIVDNGQQAVDKTWESFQSGRPFDVVLMDMEMPVMDGYSAASALRQRHYPGAIIALTAHATGGDRERCLTAGCDDFVTKPVDRAQLLRTIDRYLGSPSRTTLTSGSGRLVREAL